MYVQIVAVATDDNNNTNSQKTDDNIWIASWLNKNGIISSLTKWKTTSHNKLSYTNTWTGTTVQGRLDRASKKTDRERQIVTKRGICDREAMYREETRALSKTGIFFRFSDGIISDNNRKQQRHNGYNKQLNLWSKCVIGFSSQKKNVLHMLIIVWFHVLVICWRRVTVNQDKQENHKQNAENAQQRSANARNKQKCQWKYSHNSSTSNKCQILLRYFNGIEMIFSFFFLFWTNIEHIARVAVSCFCFWFSFDVK